MRSKNPQYFELILKCINDYKAEFGSSPTVIEISEITGLSKTTVSRYIIDMRERDIIEYSGHRNIVTRESKREQSEMVRVPILGNVSCGIPKYAEENI